MIAASKLVRIVLVALAMLPALAHVGPARADDAELARWSLATEERLKTLETARDTWASTPPDDTTLADAQETVTELRSRAENCVVEFTDRLASVQEKLKALGQPDEKAVGEIRKVREQLGVEQQLAERQLARCKLLSLSARDLKDAFAQQHRQLLSQEMLNRKSDILQAFKDTVVNGLDLDKVRRLTFEPWPAVAIGLLLAGLLLPLSFALLKALQKRFPLPAKDETTAPRRRTILLRMYKRRAPWLVGLLAFAATFYAGGAVPLGVIAAALFLSVGFAPLLQLLICQGRLRCNSGMPARLLMDLLLVAGALMLIGPRQYLPEYAFVLLRGLFFLALAGNAMWLLRRLSGREELVTLRSIMLPISIALLAGPVVDWVGYHNLGGFLTLGVYGTGAGILLVWLTLSSLSHVLNALGDTADQSQSGLRHFLGYQPGEKVSGISFMRWLLTIAALVGLGYWLMFAWQVSASDKAIVRDWVQQGFEIGAVHIVPGKLFGAIVAFLVLLTIARWLRRQLGERWLTRTSLDSGARQSIVVADQLRDHRPRHHARPEHGRAEFPEPRDRGRRPVGRYRFRSAEYRQQLRIRPDPAVRTPGTPGRLGGCRRHRGLCTQDQYPLHADPDIRPCRCTGAELGTDLQPGHQPDAVRQLRPGQRAVGVAYGTDTRKVRDILNKVAREHPMAVLHDPRVSAPRVYVHGIRRQLARLRGALFHRERRLQDCRYAAISCLPSTTPSARQVSRFRSHNGSYQKAARRCGRRQTTKNEPQ